MSDSDLSVVMRAARTTHDLLRHGSVSAEDVRQRCEYAGLSGAYRLLNALALALPLTNADGRWFLVGDERDDACHAAALLRQRIRDNEALTRGEQIMLLRTLERTGCPGDIL